MKNERKADNNVLCSNEMLKSLPYYAVASLMDHNLVKTSCNCEQAGEASILCPGINHSQANLYQSKILVDAGAYR